MARHGSKVRSGFSHALRLVTVAALVVVFVPLGALPAHGNGVPHTYWVSATLGDDTHTGTEAEPFKTITWAVNNSTPLDTIMVMPGTYDTALGENFPILLNGQSLISTGGWSLTNIVGDHTKRLLYFDYWASGDSFTGFTIHDGGSSTEGPAVQVYMRTGATAPNAPLVAHNVFDDCAGGTMGGALSVSGDAATALVIDDNLFNNNSAVNGGDIGCASFGAITITGNTFQGGGASSNGGSIYFQSHNAL